MCIKNFFKKKLIKLKFIINIKKQLIKKLNFLIIYKFYYN